jgi:hypothetical protein
MPSAWTMPGGRSWKQSPGAARRTFPTVNDAIARLTEAEVLKQITIGKRNRAFEAKEVIAFTSLERLLASPGGRYSQLPAEQACEAAAANACLKGGIG